MKRLLIAIVAVSFVQPAFASDECVARAGWLSHYFTRHELLMRFAEQNGPGSLDALNAEASRKYDLPYALQRVREACNSEEIDSFFNEGPVHKDLLHKYIVE